MVRHYGSAFLIGFFVSVLCPVSGFSQDPPTLEQKLLAEPVLELAKSARKQGDATRGALLFYQQDMACGKCHSTGEKPSPLGPDLSKVGKVEDVYLIESLLHPSKEIKKGFESVVIATKDGRILSGLIVKEDKDQITLSNPGWGIQTMSVAVKDVDFKEVGKLSLMPQGLVNLVGGRQQFLDLARFLMEIAEKGSKRAEELRPPPSFFAVKPLPEYEKNLDHTGLIESWSPASLKRGEKIYMQVCANCHGTHDKPGSLPTSLKFAADKFKNGNDPYSMYRTLTHGYGLMVGQTWMVPEQKYDVIHYIREAYLKKYNPSQYVSLDKQYLAQLPRGNTRGPKPSNVEPWVNMNYGSSLTATYEVGNDGTNFAYTGIAMRLDAGPGGVSRGRHWMVFDHDTMRVAATWTGKEFMDWNAILFNGRHAIHPRIGGDVVLANRTAPGWANPKDGSFTDVRIVGRDGKHYGPLPKSWATYKGLYHYQDKTIISYKIGETDILEMPGLEMTEPASVYSRTFHIGPRTKDLILQVAHQENATLNFLQEKNKNVVLFGNPFSKTKEKASRPFAFDGSSRLEVADAGNFDMIEKDYTLFAKIKTNKGGTIFAKTAKGDRWVPDGKALFVRNNRLVFDIGWVGMVSSKQVVADNKWHDVAMTYEHQSGQVRLFIDGKEDGRKALKPKARVQGHVVRLGYAAPNFPGPLTFFDGQIADVGFFQRKLADKEIQSLAKKVSQSELIGRWKPGTIRDDQVVDESQRKHHAKVIQGDVASSSQNALALGLWNAPQGTKWIQKGDELRLKIPAGKDAIKYTMWFASISSQGELTSLAKALPEQPAVLDLTSLTHGGPKRWNSILTTKGLSGNDSGPFAIDVLIHPEPNPWSCRMRFTGFDFFPDGDRMAVCSWDGDVWLVQGIEQPEKGITWQRIASGLFQPLGLKIVGGQIYVGCRDQIVILRDLNGDGETDFYENFNSDHQVTDHFHEFAMGLQTDEEGNFYYARAARHALPALVPHHGTLLKVSKDGSRTDILATGFRAPNGVCLNPDGTFFVTDQEGHWNPKNRINWVDKGGFYGNIYGYHDVTDTSDTAMKQPLCWITNGFDRSPAELLWVDSEKWQPLKGSLLNLSYGYGKVMIVPHETIRGVMQGGVCDLPIPQFPTGIMRARFHPANGQLYACGMFAWAGNQQEPGGLYRIRYTGKPVHLPVGLQAKRRQMVITFSDKLDRKTSKNLDAYQIKTWDLKRSAGYGSKHYNEKFLKVTGIQLSEDGKTVSLEIPDLEPTWCMEIRYNLQGVQGNNVTGVIHNTIHHLGE